MPESTTFVCDQYPAIVDAGWIEKITTLAKVDQSRRARLCLHSSNDDPIHEMFSAICKDEYIRPHRQLAKNKSYFVVAGEMRVVFFDDNGNVTRRIEMTDHTGGKVCMCRFDSGQWHMLEVLSDVVVYVETINGPFKKENTEYAQWAPETNDLPGIKTFLGNINSEVSQL